VNGERSVEADGATVREVLDDLTSRFPALRGQVFEGETIAPFINVFLESEDVRTLDGLETSVKEGSTLMLLPAMAGGA
jgi:molybdopterin converting factor small subunit